MGSEEFSVDFDALGAKKPAPHECMSCVVGLRTYPDYFNDREQREFFSRCIIGMKKRFNKSEPVYDHQMSKEKRDEIKKERAAYKRKNREVELLNCVIGLLNSSIIDVDRLDYIIRDSQTIGFKNVQVDYIRLLEGLRILEYDSSSDRGKKSSLRERFCVGYHKNALSVIESTIYAHDAEKKWIQGHPAILYEMAVLQNAMEELTHRFSTESDSNPIFCYEALTEAGKEISFPVSLFSDDAKELWNEDKLFSPEANVLMNEGKLFYGGNDLMISGKKIVRTFPLCLLADEDFLYLMKFFCKNGLGYEYFARNRRRFAAWKSEAEFRALFQERIGDDSKNIKKLEDSFEGLMEYCLAKTGTPIVKSEIYTILDEEEKEAVCSKKKGEFDDEFYEDIEQGIMEKRRWVKVLENIANELDLNFEFLIIFQKKFNSSFRSTVGDIPILFPNLNDSITPLKNVVDILRSSADKKSNFFHIFYSPKDSCERSKREIVNTLAEKLIASIYS